MFKNILVPLDGSATSLRALGIAVALAKLDGATIHLLEVVDDSAFVFSNPAGLEVNAKNGSKLLNGEIARANEYLAEAANLVRASGIERVETQVLRGIASEVISKVAAGGYDLVAMTSYGRTPVGEEPIGSIATQVINATHLPVLLVSPDYPALDSSSASSPPIRRILVPLDGSARAAQAIPIAVNLARDANATVILLGVTPHPAYPRENVLISQALGGNAVLTEIVPLGATEGSTVNALQASNGYRYLSETARHFIPAGITYGIVETSGNPTHAILANAERMDCDLIIMTAHGYPGADLGILSEVAWEVASQATMPTMILRGERVAQAHSAQSFDRIKPAWGHAALAAVARRGCSNGLALVSLAHMYYNKREEKRRGRTYPFQG